MFSNTEVLVYKYTEKCMFYNAAGHYYRHCFLALQPHRKLLRLRSLWRIRLRQFKKLKASCKCFVYTAFVHACICEMLCYSVAQSYVCKSSKIIMDSITSFDGIFTVNILCWYLCLVCQHCTCTYITGQLSLTLVKRF